MENDYRGPAQAQVSTPNLLLTALERVTRSKNVPETGAGRRGTGKTQVRTSPHEHHNHTLPQEIKVTELCPDTDSEVSNVLLKRR